MKKKRRDRKHECFFVGPDVKVHGDPNMTERDREAVLAIAEAAKKLLGGDR